MDKITGKYLETLPYEGIRKVADLTYYEGPLLSLFRDFDGQSYLYHWCDSDDICNRWLVYQITEQQFENYLKQNLTLYEIVTQPVNGETYVVDIDGQGKHRSVLLTQPKLLPDDYLPREGTFYDPNTTVFYEDEICGESLSILLDEIQRLRHSHRNGTSPDQITLDVVKEPVLHNA